MTQDLEQAGLDVVDRFINTWNSRDPERWAASLNYPHVRPSPAGPILVAKDAVEYTSGVDFNQVVATGWDHSEWDYRQVIHTSPKKIHVAGQWSRYNVEGNVIHTNPIVYIVTLVDGSWGIQSRFAADYAGDDHDTSGLESRAFRLIEDFTSHLNSNNVEACAELLNYPHYGIGTGHLQEYLEPAQFTGTENKVTVTSLQVLQAGKKSSNAGLDLIVQDDSGKNEFQAVVNVTVRDDHLGLQAWSVLDPNAE